MFVSWLRKWVVTPVMCLPWLYHWTCLVRLVIFSLQDSQLGKIDYLFVSATMHCTFQLGESLWVKPVRMKLSGQYQPAVSMSHQHSPIRSSPTNIFIFLSNSNIFNLLHLADLPVIYWKLDKSWQEILFLSLSSINYSVINLYIRC